MQPAPQYDERTGWTGWVTFAAVIMIIAGTLNAIYGLVALFNDEWVVWTNKGNLYLDLTAWGWIHLILGILVLLAGFGLFTGNMAARAAAVVLAGLSLIANFLWLPLFPVWALVVMTLDVLVIYGVVAHGGEMREY